MLLQVNILNLGEESDAHYFLNTESEIDNIVFCLKFSHVSED